MEQNIQDMRNIVNKTDNVSEIVLENEKVIILKINKSELIYFGVQNLVKHIEDEMEMMWKQEKSEEVQ